jgi:hypothetical protein
MRFWRRCSDIDDRERGLVLLVIGATAFFGAGVADVAFSDVIPMRPYSTLFLTLPVLRKRHSGHRDYNANRDVTHYLEQPNEPLELYVQRKRKAFKEKYPGS